MSTLAAWTWQGLIVALAATAALRLLKRSNAATRHICAWAALLIVLFLPLVPILRELWVPAAPVTAAGSQPAASVAPSAIVLPAWPALANVALIVWAVVTARGLARLGAGIARTRALKATTCSAPELRRRLKRWGRCAARGRRVDLRVSDACTAPCAAGLGPAYIVLPRALADTLPDEELEAIVLHEHAHLARRDDWSRLLQLTIVACAWWHPAIRLLSRAIDIEREAACDDWVLRAVMPGREYARCLLTVADRLRGNHRSGALDALVPSALGSKPVLRLRVARLLDGRTDHTRRVRWPFVAAGLAALGCVCVGAIRTTPIVTFERVADDAGSAPGVPGLDQSEPPVGTSPVPEPAVVPKNVAPAPAAARVTTARARRPAVQAEPSIARSNASADEPRPLPRAADDPPPLAAQAVTFTPAIPPAVEPAIAREPAGRAPSPWGRAASAGAAAGTQAGRAGTATGRGLQRAGVSIGSFFGRASRSLADGFQ